MSERDDLFRHALRLAAARDFLTGERTLPPLIAAEQERVQHELEELDKAARRDRAGRPPRPDGGRER